VESPIGDTAESVSNRHLVDAGGLVVTDPDLPLFCYLKTKVQSILFNFLCIVVGKFHGPPLFICTRILSPKLIVVTVTLVNLV
jgi:hypothetical protein